MTDIPDDLPQKQAGSLLAVAAVEYLLRRDDEALNELLNGADVLELGFGLAWAAGNLAAFIRCAAPDPLAVVAGFRRELLDG